MTGALTSHAEFRRDQLDAMVRDLVAEVARLTNLHKDALAGYASSSGVVGWDNVRLAKDNLEQAEARLAGARTLLERARLNLEDPAYRALLEKGDALAEQAQSQGFIDGFGEDFAPRIESAVATLLALVAEVEEAGAEALKPSQELLRISKRLGFRDLFSGRRFQPDVYTVAELSRKAVERALKGADESKLAGFMGLRRT